jgi:hypothetical protein
MHVFISYRRDDSAAVARLIHNELSARFGPSSIFMDLDDIDYGENLARVIDEHIARSDVVVVVIGPRWRELIESFRCSSETWPGQVPHFHPHWHRCRRWRP